MLEEEEEAKGSHRQTQPTIFYHSQRPFFLSQRNPRRQTMDPTKKKYSPTTRTPSRKPITSSIPNNRIEAQKSVSNHNKHSLPQSPSAPNPALVHTHLSPKSLTLSSNVSHNSTFTLSSDFSQYSSLVKKTHHIHPKPIKQNTVNMEKQRENREEEKAMDPRARGGGRRELEPSIGGERRRSSFCHSQIKLGDFFTNLGARIVSVDMPPFMQAHAVSTARKAYDSLEKFSSKTLASILKKEFDGVYGAAWHCIIGTSFGSFVTHSIGGFLYFSMDHKLYILLFKTTVLQKSD